MRKFFAIISRLWAGEVRSSHHDLSQTLGVVGVAIEKFASRVLEIRGKKRMELRGTITRACPSCGAGGDGRTHWISWVCHECGGPRPEDDVRDGDREKKIAGLMHLRYHN